MLRSTSGFSSVFRQVASSTTRATGAAVALTPTHNSFRRVQPSRVPLLCPTVRSFSSNSSSISGRYPALEESINELKKTSQLSFAWITPRALNKGLSSLSSFLSFPFLNLTMCTAFRLRRRDFSAFALRRRLESRRGSHVLSFWRYVGWVHSNSQRHVSTKALHPFRELLGELTRLKRIKSRTSQPHAPLVIWRS